MARNFDGGHVQSEVVSSTVSPRLASRPSARYIDLRFSRRASQDFRARPYSEDYDSEDFITLSFPRVSERRDIAQESIKEHQASLSYDTPECLEKPVHAIRVQSGNVDHGQSTRAFAAARLAGLELFPAEFKEMSFPRVSKDNLKVDIEDFYASITVGLDSLGRLADSAFLTDDFLQQSTHLLQSVDNDVRTLVEKLADLMHPCSVEFRHAVAEYKSVSRKILDVCNALKFTTTLLMTYQNSQVEAALAAVEALVSLPGTAPRAMHVAKAKEAGRCIDACQTEMGLIQEHVKSVVESGSYGSLLYFVPDLNLANAESEFAKWYGLWGVLFAQKTVASYISQLLLAAFAYAGEGPTLVASTTVTSFNSGWASTLVNLHIHARKQFNKMKDSSKSSCTFMNRDNNRLQYMLDDTKGHLQSLLDQGKFLNMGVYIGSWKADRKKLVHNVPLLRQHFMAVQHRLPRLAGSIESLASNIVKGQCYLTQLSVAHFSPGPSC